MRSATADVMVTLQAHKEMSLEECMEYIGDDELVEITPENVRIRKALVAEGFGVILQKIH